MAEWTTAYINDLPDSSFAYIEPGGTKDREGKTLPRSLRHLPYRDSDGDDDEPHIRNALARLPQSDLSAGAKAQAKRVLDAAAARAGIDVAPAKALTELKAEPMTTGQLDHWLQGQIPRRMLALPYGGPIPAPDAPLGVDLDGEWFDAETDIYGGHPALLRTRERLMDFHHGNDPTHVMKGAILGRVVLDEAPESDGWWVDFWANAGEQRLKLVAALEERGARLYGSSQAAYKRTGKAGHIDVWPWIRQTVSTAPQNTYAVMPSLKAVLAADLPSDALTVAAYKAAMVGLDPAPDALLGSDFSHGGSPFRAGGSDPAEPSDGLTAADLDRISLALERLAAHIPS